MFWHLCCLRQLSLWLRVYLHLLKESLLKIDDFFMTNLQATVVIFFVIVVFNFVVWKFCEFKFFQQAQRRSSSYRHRLRRILSFRIRLSTRVRRCRHHHLKIRAVDDCVIELWLSLTIISSLISNECTDESFNQTFLFSGSGFDWSGSNCGNCAFWDGGNDCWCDSCWNL
jgi:hypothetical protein